jgi:histidine ammonia-lyase
MVIYRARRLVDAALSATGLAIHALKGNAHHYHPTISRAKPHPGQALVARRLLGLLESSVAHGELEANEVETLQDPYSIRCCPQVLGVLVDSLEWISRWIEIEANSNNDNPICDPETGEVLMGGNFYGGHVVFAMDSIKAALASVADMCDRQVQLLVNPNVNRGLPADLVMAPDETRLYNHGFKAMSISASALAAEALKLTMPASSFSRSTESHNQDKVSMGTIGARDAARVCQLTERVIAITLLAAAQACDIRGRIDCRPRLKKIHDEIRAMAAPNTGDRPMDCDIDAIADAIRAKNTFNPGDEQR